MRANLTIIIILLSSIIFLTSCSGVQKSASRPSFYDQVRTGEDSKSSEQMADSGEATAEKEEAYDADDQLKGLGYVGDESPLESANKAEIPADEPVESAKRMLHERKQVEPEMEGFAVGKTQGEYAEDADIVTADELNAPAEAESESLALSEEDIEKKAKDKSSGGGGGGGGRDGWDKRDDITTEEPAEPLVASASKPAIADSETEKEVSLQEFRIRSRFPEIIFYHPNLITDENGETSFTFPAQDAITEYAIDIHAASEDGEWGYGQSSFKTFQPFFIDFNPPGKIYTDDKIEFKAAIFNYLDKPVTVKVSAEVSGGINLDTETFPSVIVNPKMVVDYPINISAHKAGIATITLTATSPGIRDSIRRTISVLPDYPEKFVNKEGILESGGAEIEINIPLDAEIMPDDFTLRIFNDTTLGALASLREMENNPHGSLTRSLAIWLSAISAYDQLDQKALLTDDLKNELTRSIDSAWLRILAFRHENGFSFFPGDNSDISDIANVIVLDSFHKVDSKYIYDRILFDQMEFTVTAIFENESNSLPDRLYAACVISDSDKIDPYIRKRIVEFLKSPQISLSSDTAIVALYSRCASHLGLKVDFEKIAELIEKPSVTQNIQTSGMPLSTISTVKALGSITNYLNLLAAFNNVKKQLTPQQNNLKSQVLRVVTDAAFSSDVSPLERTVSRLLLLNSGNAKSFAGNVEVVKINGNSVAVIKESSWFEIPIELAPGDNKVYIKTSNSNSYYQIVGRYYHKSSVRKSDIIDYTFPRNPDSNNTFNAKLTIYDPETVFEKESIIRLPLPCGVKPIDSPAALAKRLGASYAEIHRDEIILYFDNIVKALHPEKDIPMRSAFNGEFFLPPPEIEYISGDKEKSTGSGSHIKWL